MICRTQNPLNSIFVLGTDRKMNFPPGFSVEAIKSYSVLYCFRYAESIDDKV